MAMAVRARALLSKPAISSVFASPSFSSSLLRHRPLAAALSELRRLPAVAEAGVFRCFSTRPTTSSLNDPSPNWSNRPPKETILLDGCDFEHWLVVMEPPEGNPTRDEIIDSYIKTLAEVVGSPEEARMKIYSVSTKHYFAFGALVSEELSYQIKKLPKVRWVLPDSYLDVKNKDYGGEPFINGQAVPYDPKYHEEWVRNNARANERSRRNDRPRNYDRSRNFERRRENMQNRDFQNTPPPPPPPMPNTQTTAPVGPGGQSFNRDQPMTSMPNAGYTNQGAPPPSSGFQNHPMGGIGGPNYQNHGSGGIPDSGYPNHQGTGGVPSSGFQSPGSGYQNKDMGGMPNGSYQNQAPGGYMNQGNGFQNQGNYQNRGNFPNQGNYQSPGNYHNQGMGGVPNNGYQNSFVPNREVDSAPNANGRDMPGRDAPTLPNRDY